MRALFNFLVKHNDWFLFLLLEGISLVLIVRFNNYQSATFFTSAGSMAGSVYSMFMDANRYFHLKTENDGLLAQNVALTRELSELKEQLTELRNSETLLNDSLVKSIDSGYKFLTANIINNSLNSVNNFITLNKGSDDGVRPEMGVFNSDGIVGVVYLTSENRSIVIPLLNSKSSISCRVKGSESFCSLSWDGGDTRYSNLIDLPRYAQFEKGDTVVTSGFSSIFPGDLPVGTVERIEDSADGMFYTVRVKLFVDFSRLTSVFIVGNDDYEEQSQLEQEITKKLK
ncbi:MAG: rod shape-determining protein MreC [Bacteroidaceae bacterium]|nr:rod shape-determining protein MreC [Bacteroidaceae bacterium]MBQ5817832.1 rod shape-determining protein MreC [Bacteroidaceae bacterium]